MLDQRDEHKYDFSGKKSLNLDNPSLLSILDDKNKTIAKLKKQIQNQKLQLMHYYRKSLTHAKLAKISKTCSADIAEESLPVVLAVSNFKRQKGIKSTIRQMYERLGLIDEHARNSLLTQEYILKKIFGDICHYLKKLDDPYNKLDFLYVPQHLDLINALLEATLDLRKKLDMFRIFGQRLILVEEERNTIVEQVLNLPSDQRMSVNYLVNVKLEKSKLESDVKSILREYNTQRESSKMLNDIEGKLTRLQNELKLTFNSDLNACKVNHMLENVNYEAMFLLELTKARKNRFQRELLKIEKPAHNSKSTTVSKIKITEVSESYDRGDKHCVIESESLQCFKTICKQLQIKEQECEDLKLEVEQTRTETEELKADIQKLKAELELSKQDHISAMFHLKEERDLYKAQVNDLEVIREAYTHLVDAQSNTSPVDDQACQKQDKHDKVTHLKKLNKKLLTRLNLMNGVIDKQNKKISIQTDLIKKLKQEKTKASNIKFSLLSTSFSNSTKFPNTKSFSDECVEDFYEECAQEIVITELSNWPKNASSICQCEDCKNCPVKTKDSATVPSVSCFKMHPKNDHLSKVIKSFLVSNSEKLNVKETPSFEIEIQCEVSNTEVNRNDDYELLKDCSQEIAPVVCPPIKKNKNVRRVYDVRDRTKHFLKYSHRTSINKTKKIEVIAKPKSYDGYSSSEENIEIENKIKTLTVDSSDKKL